jgi:hypothetical protein
MQQFNHISHQSLVRYDVWVQLVHALGFFFFFFLFELLPLPYGRFCNFVVVVVKGGLGVESQGDYDF